jgi:4-hydroxy-3-methylbut-2-enyl diphosphate reductase IspH
MKTNRNPIELLQPSGMSTTQVQDMQKILHLSRDHRLWSWQPLSPNPLLQRSLEEEGLCDHPQDLRSDSVIVIPPFGAPLSYRKEWKMQNRTVLDLSTPEVRRAQSTLALLKLEGAELLVIGRKSDPEVQAHLIDHPRARVIENAEDAVRIPFAPAFNLICQTSHCPHLARHLTSVIQGRHRDSRVSFLDTSSTQENLRRAALTQLVQRPRRPDLVLVFGYSHSAEMLLHAACEHRLQAQRISHGNLPTNLQNHARIALIASDDITPHECSTIIHELEKNRIQDDPYAA